VGQSESQCVRLARIMIRSGLLEGTTMVTREALRTAWIAEYPHDNRSRYQPRLGVLKQSGDVGSHKVRSGLRVLEQMGVVKRTPEHVFILDYEALKILGGGI
jgi:hypothetical protein